MNKRKFGEIFFVSNRICFIVCTQCKRRLSDYQDFLNHVLEMHFRQLPFESFTDVDKNGIGLNDQHKDEDLKEFKDESSSYNKIEEITLQDESFITCDLESNYQSEYETKIDNMDENVEISFEEEKIICGYNVSPKLNETIKEIKEECKFDNVSPKLNEQITEIKLEYQFDEIKKEIENSSSGEDDDRRICNYCGELFEVERFEKHKMQRSCGKCPVCNCSVSNIFRHVQQHHSEYKAEKERLKERAIKRLPLFDDAYNNIKKGYSCCYCERTFTSKKYYASHLKHHEENPNKCKFCGKVFKLPYLLKKHLRIHTNERPYKCEICSHGFNDDRNLKTHFINRHTEGLNLKCRFENCNKIFKTETRRKYHESYAHTSKYTTLCKECGLTFKTSGLLNDHKKKVHMKYEDRQFSCKYCEKKFAFKYELIPHENAHTGEKPYKCKLCPKTYVDGHSLKRHCLNIHGRDPKAL